VDARVAELAGRQEGMVSTAQLVGLGIGRSGIHERVRRGWLHPYCRGVYSVGHARVIGPARLWAAVLACGGPAAAVLSHRTAAALWELIRMPTGPVDVITLRQSYSTKLIRVHRTRTLIPDDVTTLDRLPVTTPTRTLIDLADQLPPQRLERALHRAEHQRLLNTAAIHARLAALPGRRPRALHHALDTLTPGPQLTRSDPKNAPATAFPPSREGNPPTT
jgi:hypothetical protein